MRTAETGGAAVQARPQRRVGTFTLGVALVSGGLCMLASLFYPALDLTWALKCSPLILVALGVETLLSARTDGRVKYDWLGMLLCFLLIGAALCMYGAVWWITNEDAFRYSRISRFADQERYQMEYQYFNDVDAHTLSLRAGEVLQGNVMTCNGWLEVEIYDQDGEILCDAAPMDGTQRMEIPKDGEYTIVARGRRASGRFSFDRVTADEEEQPEEAPIEEEGAA